MITFHFHRNKKFLSFLIRLFSLGKFSHVSIEINRWVYEAVWNKGVIVTRYTKWDSSTVVESIEIKATKTQVKKAQSWLEQQIGKGYDFMGIFSFLFRLLPPVYGWWYCSELATAVLAKLKNTDINNKKSPQQFYELANLVK